MSGVGIHQGYDVSAQSLEISNSVMSCGASRAQPASSSLKAIACASGTQGSGGILLFNLPSNASGFIKDGSAFIRFTLTVTGTAADVATGGNAISSFASLIQRLTLQSNGVLEQIQYYGNVYEPLLMEHTAGYSYFNSDYQILACPSMTIGGGGTVSATIVLPLLNGAFNSPSGQNFPLCLFPSGLQLQLDLASDTQALTVAHTATFTVSNAFFHYEEVDVGMEYVNSLRQSLIAENKLFEMPFVSALVMAVSSASTIDNTFGVGLLSMKSVLTTNIKSYAQTEAKYQTYQGSVNFRVYADGRLLNQWVVPSSTLNAAYGDIPSQYALLQSSLDNLASRVSSSGPAMGNTSAAAANTYYADRYWCTGVSANHFEEHGFLCLQGTKVNQLQIHLELPNVVSGSTYFTIFMDNILCISPATGEATVIR